MENITNHASSLTARKRGKPVTANKYWRNVPWRWKWGARGERRKEPEKETTLTSACVLHFIPCMCLRGSARSPRTPLAPFARGLGAGLATRLSPWRRPSSATPTPPPSGGPAGRRLHPPRVPRRKRTAADLPRWHCSRKPSRNCKANKAEILDWSQSWQDLRFCRQFVCAALFKGTWLRKCWK